MPGKITALRSARNSGRPLNAEMPTTVIPNLASRWPSISAFCPAFVLPGDLARLGGSLLVLGPGNVERESAGRNPHLSRKWHLEKNLDCRLRSRYLRELALVALNAQNIQGALTMPHRLHAIYV